MPLVEAAPRLGVALSMPARAHAVNQAVGSGLSLPAPMDDESGLRPPRTSLPVSKRLLTAVPTVAGEDPTRASDGSMGRSKSGSPMDSEPTRPSHAPPEPLPSLSQGLSAPRVPTFSVRAPGSSLAPPSTGPGALVGSLAPGASVWPDKARPALAAVPLPMAIIGAVCCLGLGFLGGFLTFAGAGQPAFEPAQPMFGSLQALPAPQLRMPEAPVKEAPSEQAAEEQKAQGEVVAEQRGGRKSSASKTKTPAKAAAPPTPVAAPFEASTETALGERLSSTEIQRTVYRYQPSVRHSCWQRQLARRDPSSAATARVAVTLTIAPNGQVTKVSTTADPPGFSGLSQCIGGKVKSWAFPKALGSTTAQIPFTFAAQ